MSENEKIALIETTIYAMAFNLMAIANGGEIKEFDVHFVAKSLYDQIAAPKS